MKLFVSCPPGLEAPCAAEVTGAGASVASRRPGALVAEGPLEALLRLCFATRIASGARLLLGAGDARAAVEGIAAVLPRGGAYALEVQGGGKAQAQVARPLEAAIRAAVPGARPDPGGTRLVARVERGRLELSADAGGTLHRRGFRLETGAAPLRENLAAGILALAGYGGDEPLVDPLCGAGTFLVEGALLALRRAPGLSRTLPCESWPAVAPRVEGVKASLRAAERERPPAPLVGSDLKAGALGVTRRNAERAGVRAFVELVRRDAREATPPPGAGPGVLVGNLPYGKRLGAPREVEALHRDLGRALPARFPGWRLALLTGSEALASKLALPGATLVHLTNGGLPVVLVLARA